MQSSVIASERDKCAASASEIMFFLFYLLEVEACVGVCVREKDIAGGCAVRWICAGKR
jgi:hypothetical protein